MNTRLTRLRQVRQERGFSSDTLAAALGLSPMAIHYWETGHSRPRSSVKQPHAQRLEAMLNTPIEELLAPANTKEADTEVSASRDRQARARLMVKLYV